MLTKKDLEFNNGTCMWKGVMIKDMTRDELHQAFKELGDLYIHTIKGQIKELEEMRSFPAHVFQIHGGKVPFVVHNGKADENEKYSIWSMGFKEAVNQIIYSIRRKR